MVSISISEALKLRCPALRLGCLHAAVTVDETNQRLMLEINQRISEIAQTLQVEGIASLPVIAASRKAYKACGKDPARYRLSAEALLRRAVSGKGLYQINNVVDQLNLVSITTGFSIGGYDADQVRGDVEFGIGLPDEPYVGIGRGELNIENLPVFRDSQGAFGTPTSDSERTSVTPNTSRFLMILIDFDSSQSLESSMKLAETMLRNYCGATGVEMKIVA